MKFLFSDSTIARDQPFANICGLPYLTGGLKIHIPDFGFLDFAHDVDVVLISNYLNMGALPYITEYLGFQGRIYATTPTAQIGREMLLELVEHAMSMGCETGAQWTNKPAKVSQHAKEFLTFVLFLHTSSRGMLNTELFDFCQFLAPRFYDEVSRPR
jgi:hypothetical protein